MTDKYLEELSEEERKKVLDFLLNDEVTRPPLFEGLYALVTVDKDGEETFLTVRAGRSEEKAVFGDGDPVGAILARKHASEALPFYKEDIVEIRLLKFTRREVVETWRRND